MQSRSIFEPFRLALVAVVVAGATAHAQQTPVYNVTLKSGTQTLPAMVMVSIPAINPHDTSQGAHNCDFLITTTLNPAASPVGTLIYGTNQYYFGGGSIYNNGLNLEQFSGAVQKDGSVKFQSTANNSFRSPTRPSGGLNPNYFQVQPISFGTGMMQIVSGTIAFTISKDGKTISGQVALGGTSDALTYPNPSRFYNATFTGSLLKVLPAPWHF